MKFQTYEEKQRILLDSIMALKIEPTLNMKPTIKNLRFDEYHRLIEKDNIFVINAPNFALNLITMKPVEFNPGKQIENVYHDSIFITMAVKMYAGSSLDEFFDKMYNEEDFFFFYTGVRLGDKIQIRVAILDRNIIKEAISRFESSQRIQSILNFNSEINQIQDYVNSTLFSEDMENVSIPLSDIVSRINKKLVVEESNPHAEEYKQKIQFEAARQKIVEGIPFVGEEKNNN
jgi:hypothetical protein